MPVHEPVSLLLATAQRQGFLRVVTRALAEQNYRGEIQTVVLPDEPSCLAGVDLPPGAEVISTGKISLGAKLAAGLMVCKAGIVMKVDDDDWYGPDYVSRMVSGLGQASLAFVQPFHFFDLRSWTLIRAGRSRCSGATITFRRSALRGITFRDVPDQVDVHFLLDALRAGVKGRAVDVGFSFLQSRHPDGAPHLWTHMADGEPVEDYTARRPPVDAPEAALPNWALTAFRSLRAREPGDT